MLVDEPPRYLSSFVVFTLVESVENRRFRRSALRRPVEEGWRARRRWWTGRGRRAGRAGGVWARCTADGPVSTAGGRLSMVVHRLSTGGGWWLSRVSECARTSSTGLSPNCAPNDDMVDAGHSE